MYPQAFSAAKQVDQAFLIILGFSVFILLLITGLMLWFLYRYNHRRHPVAEDSEGNMVAEAIWIVLPTIIVLGLFWTGWTSFKAMRTIPEGAMEVAAEGRMWSWRFTYPNGKISDELWVPVNTPVKLNLSAKDVIHSFYVPAMRLKWDMVPGMDTDAWFESDTLGNYDIFCAEYCGLKHADMVTTLHVVSAEDYDAWLASGPGSDSALDGLALMEQNGCYDCHSMDGTDGMGPPLNDIAGKEVTLALPNGGTKTEVRDAAYLHRAMVQPGAELVEGYDDMMPSNEDMPENVLNAIVGALLDPDGAAEAAGKAKAAPHPGEQIADEEGCTACHTTDGTDDVGPTFLGLAGSERTVESEMGGETKIIADPAYLRQSILHPDELVTEGYDPTMPVYDGMDPARLDVLIEWLGTLSGKTGQAGETAE
ncbi:MAG: cytochrome c oxidase subunit II [Desulfovibrionaceae bacterium]